MKSSILLSGILLMSLGVFAQNPTDSAVPSGNTPGTNSQKVESYSGGYGHFTTGIGWITPNDLIDHLQSPDVLGPTFTWDNAGISAGGEGFAEIHNLIIGGGGYGMYIQDMESENGIVRFSYGGGYVKVGYVPLQTPRHFLSVNAGFGGGVMYVGIENTSTDRPIFFSSNVPVLPLQDKDYFRGYLQYDLSVSSKVIATKIDPNRRKFGGVMFGLDLGANFGIPVDTWRDEYGTVSGIPSPGNVFSPYLRLTIGGGGFRKFYAYQ